MRTAMDSKTRKTKILMLSCLSHNNFPIHKPPPNPSFQQHFCGMYVVLLQIVKNNIILFVNMCIIIYKIYFQ